jgi:hypothetical protein
MNCCSAENCNKGGLELGKQLSKPLKHLVGGGGDLLT